jgi:hypothetical protein
MLQALKRDVMLQRSANINLTIMISHEKCVGCACLFMKIVWFSQNLFMSI